MEDAGYYDQITHAHLKRISFSSAPEQQSTLRAFFFKVEMDVKKYFQNA